MAYTAYRVLRAPIDKIEDLMTAAIADGWQPSGAPVLTAPDTNMVYQAIVKGTPDGGGGPVTITVNDISDASQVGKSVLLADDGAAVRTEIGAGTSNLKVGTAATDAKAGNYTPPNVTTTVNGLMIASDKDKLDKIAASATANDTDANLKDRSKHTGSQATSTITGLDAALAGKASGSDLSALAARVTALEAAT